LKNIGGDLTLSNCGEQLYGIAYWNGTCFVAPYPGKKKYGKEKF